MRKETKWQKKGGAYFGGLRMRVTDCDIDFVRMRSIPYRHTRKMYERMLTLKREMECDYIHDEYDCTGSRQTRCQIHRKGGRLVFCVRETYDL